MKMVISYKFEDPSDIQMPTWQQKQTAIEIHSLFKCIVSIQIKKE